MEPIFCLFVDRTKDAYINTSCSDLLDNLSPTIVGEWSLSVADKTGWNPDWNPESNTDFYKRWFAAQATTYEKRLGWIFWTWKAELGD
ncbi:Glycoside hydrolase, catalytic core [Penicillium camemberti]|uniref:Glycoside hydrolase, catalytic core n=1 Tax=Penicillium camemberti (strain FM 013) TaxID=1429867 RepID=A0A0G4P7P6_PENC3|nr:Glycoside hydrolase, catalytic core [Penicillium camemberti]